MGRAPLVLATLALAAGIAAAVQRPVPAGGGPFVFGLIAVGAALAIVSMLRSSRGGIAPLACLMLAGAALGGTARIEADRSCAAWLPADVPLTVEAEVLAVRADRLELRSERVRVGERSVACAAVLSARWEGPPVLVGTSVSARGRWWLPPSGRRLLDRPGILIVHELERTPSPVAGPAMARVKGIALRLPGRARTAAADRLDHLYGERAPLAMSLLLARRDRLDREVRDRFARAGLSHLLAISGLHVGLVAGILILLAGFARVPRTWIPWVAGGATVTYVLFLGAPHSAVRAAIQIVLVMIARSLQRPTRTESLVAAAAFALLVWEPAALLSPGFQLSFAGVVGILALRRPLLGRAHGLAAWRPAGLRAGHWLADGLATSVAATLATAPIVAWHFGRVAPIGIVANLAAIPLLAAAVPSLALSLALASVSEPAGQFLADGAALLLTGLDRTASVAAAVPAGTIAVGPASALGLSAAAGAGFIASRRLGQVRRSVRITVWLAAACAVWGLAPLRPAGDAVEVHVIDVGQGDAVAVRSPAGRWLLVDAGVAGAGYDAGERRVVPYLGRRGVRRLEGLVLTHPDADHIGGAAAVVRALRPRWIGDPVATVGKPGYLALLQVARGAGVRWVGLSAGLAIELDGMMVEFLHPPAPAGRVEDANDASVVIRVEYGEFSVLLTGDAPEAVEDRLVRRYGSGLEAEVLKVGHHGSATSTSSGLLAVATPAVAVISAGRGNRYGHPHRTVLERLSERGVRVHRTDREGSVVVRGDARGRVRVRTERGGSG